MNVDRATLLAKIEDLQTIRDLVDETLTSLHALVGDVVEPLDSAPAPSARASAPVPFCAACGVLGDGPSRRPTPGARVGPRPKHTAIKMDGALAASIRRACANEAADFLQQHPFDAYSTAALVRHVPSLAKRYVGTAHQAAALSSILRSMGAQFYVRNVSRNTRARWMYRSPMSEIAAPKVSEPK